MTNKEAIEELKKVDTLDMPARLCEAHYMAIKALEQTKWIPVSERLPEDKTYVLTTIKVPNRVAHARSGWYEVDSFTMTTVIHGKQRIWK